MRLGLTISVVALVAFVTLSGVATANSANHPKPLKARVIKTIVVAKAETSAGKEKVGRYLVHHQKPKVPLPTRIRHGGFEVLIVTCKRRQTIGAEIAHQHKSVHEVKLEAFQASVSYLAERSFEACYGPLAATARGIYFNALFRGSSGKVERFNTAVKNYWQLDASKKKFYQERRQQGARKKFAWADRESSNPLEDRGYVNSWLIDSPNNLKVYAALRPKARTPELVLVHKVSGHQKLFDPVTKTVNNSLNHYVPYSFLKSLQASLDKAIGYPLEKAKLKHYVEGIRHPEDARAFVKNKSILETPILVHRMAYYQADRPLIMPRDVFYDFADLPAHIARKQFESVAAMRKVYGETSTAAKKPAKLKTADAAAVHFEALGMHLLENRQPNGTTTLEVSKSTIVDAELVVGNQLISINKYDVYSFADVEQALEPVFEGAQVTLEVYVPAIRKSTFNKVTLAPVSNKRKKFAQAKVWNLPSKAYLQEQKKERGRALRFGYVYKNENYWAEFKGTRFQGFFDGSNTGYDLNSSGLKHIILPFIETKSARCASGFTPLDAAFSISQKRVTFNGYGTPLGSSTQKLRTVQVSRRFAPIYAHYYQAKNFEGTPGDALASAVEFLRPQNLGAASRPLDSALRMKEGIRHNLGLLFERESCTSPVLLQFEENLYRYAFSSKLKPVQKAPKRFKGARKSSDKLYKPGSAKTITTACMEEYDFLNARSGKSNRKNICRCRSEVLGARLDSSNLAAAKSDFRTFMRKLEAGHISANNSLYQAVRRCAQRR